MFLLIDLRNYSRRRGGAESNCGQDGVGRGWCSWFTKDGSFPVCDFWATLWSGSTKQGSSNENVSSLWRTDQLSIFRNRQTSEKPCLSFINKIEDPNFLLKAHNYALKVHILVRLNWKQRLKQIKTETEDVYHFILVPSTNEGILWSQHARLLE